jgi:hydrogenase maturation factor HypF (carbamoyltransferase family)
VKSHRKSAGTLRSAQSENLKNLLMFLVPCSCGTTFAVAENYDRQGTAWSRYLACPACGKRHDPKNRLLQMGFHREGYWKVDKC